MLAILGMLISGVLSGGATGLLGVILQRYFDLKGRDRDLAMLKLQHEQALALAQIESAQAQRRAEADEFAADRQAQADEAAADARSLAASYEADRATYLAPEAQRGSRLARTLFAVVDAVRGLIRPVLTMYLVVLVTAMFVWARELAGAAALTPADAVQLIGQIVATILYLCTACVLWWFGSRPPKSPGGRG